MALTEILASQGAFHQFFYVERPEQNSVVERKHQHFFNVAKALFFESKVPIIFCGECVTVAAFVINMIPSPLLHDKSPYQVLFCSSPDYGSVRSFGCLAFA